MITTNNTNSWGADFADMKWILNYNKWFRILLFFIYHLFMDCFTGSQANVKKLCLKMYKVIRKRETVQKVLKRKGDKLFVE